MKYINLLIYSVPLLAQGWTDLTNTHMAPVCTYSGYYCTAIMQANSGGAFDTLRNHLLVMGDGHGDGPDGATYQFDLNTNTWSRLLNSGPVNPNYQVCQITIDGFSPDAAHTYDGIEHNPFVDKMIMLHGPTYCANGTHFGDLWSLDIPSIPSLGRHAWLRLDPVNGATGKQPSSFYTSPPMTNAYDPNTHLNFITSTAQLWSYDAVSNTYAFLNGSLNPPFTATSTIDPVHKLLVLIGSTGIAVQYGIAGVNNPAIKVVDISPGSNYAAQNWMPMTTGCAVPFGGVFPGVAYNPDDGLIYVWPSFGNSVWSFDVTTKVCTQLTFPGGPPDSLNYNKVAYSTGTAGRFRYVPLLHEFVVANDVNNDVFTLQVGPVPPPPPPPPVLYDLNGDGSVTPADVDLAIQMYERTLACSGDPNSLCDIHFVIAAAKVSTP